MVNREAYSERYIRMTGEGKVFLHISEDYKLASLTVTLNNKRYSFDSKNIKKMRELHNRIRTDEHIRKILKKVNARRKK